MRSVFRLLSALATVGALAAAPLAAHAADAKTPYTKEQIAQGKKEAPAVMATSSVACTVTDAAFMGTNSSPKDAQGKPIKGKQSIYEVACQEGLGYAVLSDPAGGKASAYDCLTTATSPGGSLTCKLPENADPKQGFAPLAAAAGRTCSPVSAARPIGANASGEAYFELKCAAGPGFVLKTAGAAKPEAIDCADTVGKGQLECTLTTAADIASAQKAVAAALVAKSGKPCALTDSRKVGSFTNGQTGYEVACGPGKGYILMADASGNVAQTIDCAKADSLAGGCTLTNAAEAKTAETGTYTRLAAASGYPCQVSKYRFIGMDAASKSEVVELACGNRPDGAIALFPADNSRGKIYDCVQAGALQQRCQFSDPSAVYLRYTQALAAKGRPSCKVSNARWLGHYTQSNSDLIETGCADGQPGWVMEVAVGSDQVKSLLSCGQAKAVGVTCALPGNTK